MKAHRQAIVWGLAVASGLFVAAPASGADVSLVENGGTATFTYSAGPGALDEFGTLNVSYSEAAGTLGFGASVWASSPDPPVAGSGCIQSSATAVACVVGLGGNTNPRVMADVDLGDGDDRYSIFVSSDRVAVPVESFALDVDLGAGPDSGNGRTSWVRRARARSPLRRGGL